MFVSEIKRAFSRMSFKLMILLGILICILYNRQFPVESYNVLSYYIKSNISTSFSRIMFLNFDSIMNLFIIIMPIISAFSFSDAYIEDMKSGIIESIYLRSSRTKYLIVKYFANFIIGGIAVSLPLIVGYVVAIITVPSIQPNINVTGEIIFKGGLFSSLFYKNAHLYSLMWIGIYFLYSGVFASIALFSSRFIKNRFVIIFIPFIINMFVTIVSEIVGKAIIAPTNFLMLSVKQSFTIMVIEFAIIFIITFIGFCFIGVNMDVYKID